MEYAGEYGGVVKREIKNAGGKPYIAGAILTPEEVEKWPLANRLALHTSGHIDWYGPPVQEEVEARNAGKPAPKRKTTEEKPAASRPRRR